MNDKTIKTYQQFIDYVFNSNAEQFVIFNGKKSKTLCTVESANKEIEKLKEKLLVEKDKVLVLSNHLTLYSSEETMLKEIDDYKSKIDKLKEYCGNTTRLNAGKIMEIIDGE